jgi:hypothetical protein
MIAVTTEEVEQADAAVVEARRIFAEAERAYASNRASADAYKRHHEAVEQVDHAEARARVLRADWEGQQAVRDLRAAEGAAAAADMIGDGEGLAASRTAAVSAVVEATAAMRVALEALAEHDRLVRAAGEALVARGLLCREGEPTGANLDGSAWIGGVQWPLVDGGGVLGHCLAEQVAARYPRHPLARPVTSLYGGATAARGRDEVLALVRTERGR